MLSGVHLYWIERGNLSGGAQWGVGAHSQTKQHSAGMELSRNRPCSQQVFVLTICFVVSYSIS